MATAWSDIKMVKYLIKHGANSNAKTDRGTSVIHSASMNKNPAILKYMLKNFKLNVNDRSKSYCSPLDFSLRMNALQNNGTLENAHLLLANGAKKSINWKCNGYTPLMVAIPDEKIMLFLLGNGAKTDIKNPSGRTAFNMAKNQKASKKILKMLKTQKNEDINKKVFYTENLIWELKTYQNKHDRYSELKAIEYCENLELDNKDNWRIPSASEYKTILSRKPYKGFVIDGIGEYYMNPKDFKNMTPTSYWTILKDGSTGYQSISWNKVHKKRENTKYNTRCVHTKI